MDCPVKPSRLQRSTVLLGGSPISLIAGVSVQEPENSGEKALAPVRPALAFAGPYPANGVHRTVPGVVREDAIAIRTMSYFCLTFDHRIVDGADADRFMQQLRKGLQEFDESAL